MAIANHMNVGFKRKNHQTKSGWWFQPSKKILVSWDDYSQYMEK